MRGLSEMPYPVCLFFFTMVDNQGLYTWYAEPIFKSGKPRLKYHEAAHCARLDNAALDKIVESVDRWYDAFYSMIKA
jgi:hypothetical protein